MTAARIFGVFLIVGAVGFWLGEIVLVGLRFAPNSDPAIRGVFHYVNVHAQIVAALLAWLMLGTGVAMIVGKRPSGLR